MSIGDNIRRLRLEKDILQQDIAKAIGVSDKAISAWENGTRIPRMGAIQKMADFFGVKKSDIIEGTFAGHTDGQFITFAGQQPPPFPSEVVNDNIKIPILGSIAAGTPITAYEDVLGYEYINESYKGDGFDYFALRVKGRSMEPTIHDGDIVIIRQQDTIEDGKIGVILIDGEDATVKEVKEVPGGIMLIGHNPAVYPPHTYTTAEIENIPVRIIGKVVEIRRRLL